MCARAQPAARPPPGEAGGDALPTTPPTGGGAAAEKGSKASVAVTFLPSGATTASAAAGDNIMAVAEAAGVTIPGGCYSGSCGLCEVEVSTADACGAALADRVVQRACIAVVPAGAAFVTIAELEDDAVWGQDGWDT